MAIKSILVPVPDGNSAPALHAALIVAETFHAHVEGLHVPRFAPSSSPRDRHFAFSASGGVATDEAVAGIREAISHAEVRMERTAKEARELFERTIAKRDIPLREDAGASDAPSASWRAINGDEAQIVANYGGGFDLIVVGHPGDGSGYLSDDTVQAALLATGTAVLVAPPVAPETIGQRILVGWNRSIQSGRAVSAAIPFLRRAEKVVVFSVTTGAKQGPATADVARWLAWHGVVATVTEVPPDYRRVGEVLLTEVQEKKIDLLVMGAYSHHRIRELILGGVTRDVLPAAEIPVLMAR
jgi:nucleotide-binding universal stress UspA family protein